MADKYWAGGGKNLIPAKASLCLVAVIAPLGSAWGLPDKFSPTSYIGSADPNMIWELLIGGVVVCSFLVAVALWIHASLRKVKRAQLRRNAFISSALNNLNHGVIMIDAQQQIVFCNNRYLEIYGLARSDIRRGMSGLRCCSCGGTAVSSTSATRISSSTPEL